METLCSALLAGAETVHCRELRSAVQAASLGECAFTARLENAQLWEQFHSITNEMIVTKAGRRLFPLLAVRLSGLDPAARYAVLLEFQPLQAHRWRFVNGEWTAGSSSSSSSSSSSGASEATVDGYAHVHPSSPATGEKWMRDCVTFAKLKISNKENGNRKLKLESLHRYQPCVYVVRLPSAAEEMAISRHCFPETQFIAVTAYQNDKITEMKIKHNPFAKAFLVAQDCEQQQQQQQEQTPSSALSQHTTTYAPLTHYPPSEPMPLLAWPYNTAASYMPSQPHL